MKMDLNQIREMIDLIDREIAGLIAQRVKLIPEIAKLKIEQGIPRKVESREQAIMQKMDTYAEELGIDKVILHEIMSDLIHESHRIEKEIMEE